MKNKHYLSLIFAFVLLFLMGFGCEVGDLIEEAELFGQWKGISVMEDGEDGEWDPSKIRFEFREDSTYTYRLAGDYKEEGTWYVYDSKLYTIASNRDDIFVYITLPTPDSLIMNQDDKGVKRVFVLQREEE